AESDIALDSAAGNQILVPPSAVMLINDAGIVVGSIIMSRAAMFDEFTGLPEIESNRSVRIGRQLSSGDDDIATRRPLFLTQIYDFETETVRGVEVANGIQTKDAHHLGKGGVGLRRIGKNDFSFGPDRLPHVVRDGANHTAMRNHVTPALGITRMALMHHVGLQQNGLTGANQFLQRVPL